MPNNRLVRGRTGPFYLAASATNRFCRVLQRLVLYEGGWFDSLPHSGCGGIQGLSLQGIGTFPDALC